MIPSLARLRESALARNALWMLLGQLGRLVLQATYFVLIARALGAGGYGAFVAVMALVGVISPFATWGAGNLIVKYVARDPGLFPRQWGRALVMAMASGGAILLLVLGTWRWFLPRNLPLSLVVSVAISDLIFARVLDMSSQAYQAFQRLARTAQLQVLVSLLKLVAAVVWLRTVDHPTAAQWSMLYLASTALAAVLAVGLVTLELGLPDFSAALADWELMEGFHFSLGSSAATIYNDIDKTMLARLSDLEATGIYGAAYRVIGIACVPIRSLQSASYARFFQRGVRGAAASRQLFLQLLPSGVAYSLVIAALLLLAAPLAPAVLGHEFDNAVETIRWLALLPLFKAIHMLAANALTGAGYQPRRTLAQVAVAGVNVLLNLWLMPRFSWRGASWSSLACDGLLAALMVWQLWRLSASGAGSEAPHEPDAENAADSRLAE